MVVILLVADQYYHEFAYYWSVLMSLLWTTIKIVRDYLEDIYRDIDIQETIDQSISDYTGDTFREEDFAFALDVDMGLDRLVSFRLYPLMWVRVGSKSFAEICTVNGNEFPTFREACYALGLLQGDKEYIDAIEEPIEQRFVFYDIMKAVHKKKGCVFFVYGYGGIGKTFLWKTLSTSIRSQGEIVLNIASSGIASLLLSGGRTAHSWFKFLSTLMRIPFVR
ncbi:hypothetical protein LXL04_010761 [Taraxacum kok-saghyz]